jgi:hypothetical protein
MLFEKPVEIRLVFKPQHKKSRRLKDASEHLPSPIAAILNCGAGFSR